MIKVTKFMKTEGALTMLASFSTECHVIHSCIRAMNISCMDGFLCTNKLHAEVFNAYLQGMVAVMGSKCLHGMEK
jgi:hypothetical protein